MTDYQQAVADTINQAATWANESTQQWLDAYAHLVDAASSGSASADTVAADLSTLAAGGARDMARVASTWFALGSALLQVTLPADGTGSGGAGGSTGGTGATGATGASGGGTPPGGGSTGPTGPVAPPPPTPPGQP